MKWLLENLRKGKASLIFILIFFGLASMNYSQSSFSGLPFVRTFHTDEYKAGLQNFNIKQDRRGLVYVANNYGLLEYDGSLWRTYGVRSGTKVRSLAVDGRGRIYVGCQGDFGYFFPTSTGQFKYTSLADSLPSATRNFDETWSVFVDKDNVYFCTFSNIYIYNGKSLQVIKPGNSIDLSFFVNRQLYVNERVIGISKLEGDRLRPVKGGEFFDGLSVSSILSVKNDHLLLSTSQHGIFQLINGKPSPWNLRNQELFKKANINCLIRLKNGQFAAGTQNEGLLILQNDGELIMQLTRGRGLENRTVLSLFEDDLNNLWVGQNNAIVHIELGSPFTFIQEQSGLPGIGYAAYLDHDKLYLGTNTGLYLKEKNVTGSFTLQEYTKGQVYSIGRYHDELLIAHQRGALRLEANKTFQISKEPGSWVFLPLKDQPEKLLEGTYTGLQLYTWRNNHWLFEKKLSGFLESSRVMAEDTDGSIWVTHGYKGAFRITLSVARDSIMRVRFYGSDKGFPTNQQINVFSVRNELLFTAQNGVYKYNVSTDRFEPDELFSTTIGQGAQLWFIQEDALGNIYFIGREHLGVLRKNAAGDYIIYENEFNKIRKYLNDDLQNIIILKNNEVLFAAKEGFIHYDPTLSFSSKSIFKTLVRKVTSSQNGDSLLYDGNYSVNDSVVDRQDARFKPILPYRNNSIRFYFSSTTYEGDGDVTYQYYLENFEKNWSAWDATAQKEYTNLKEKRYIFHVRSKNINGLISDEVTYEFRITPPWYRSQWAYGLYSLSIISFLILSFIILDRKYQRAQKMMALAQKRELYKKDNEMVQLSIYTQEEITRLQNEKLEAELNHMKNELATATMHLLNKNEFIADIKSNLNQIVKKGAQGDLKDELSSITKDIENNISDDGDWEHFQFHFDRVHGDFTTRLKLAFSSLSPQETKLSAYLRMNLSSKEIAQLLNITVRGVEISRYRLRKKLNLGREQNLQEFILNF